MLVPWPHDEEGMYLAVVAFPGTIFFGFLNLALPANSLSSGWRSGFASAISSSVGLALEGPNCWPLSDARGGGGRCRRDQGSTGVRRILCSPRAALAGHLGVALGIGRGI